MTINELDKKIINAISAEFPIIERPFSQIADTLGISEKEVIERVSPLEQNLCIRRIGAALNHMKAGYSYNVMVVWDIADELTDEMGVIMAKHASVSHCYCRVRNKDWRYNLYTMIHARTVKEANEAIEEIKAQITYKEYQTLQTMKELKKTGMKYFQGVL